MEDFKINMFIEPIINKKKKHDFWGKIRLNKFLKKLKKTSPDFNMMTDIYKFLILIEKIYMYGNDDSHFLFSAVVPKGFNSAFIYKEKDFNIKFILRNEDKEINIIIERILRSKKETTTITFNDGQCKINNIYEEETFIFIIACLMDGLCDLIKYYYDNKKF